MTRMNIARRTSRMIGLSACLATACSAGPPAVSGPSKGAAQGTNVPASSAPPPVATSTLAPTCPDEGPILVEIATESGGSQRVMKVHPAVMKAYRIDVCYWGTLDIEAARASYLRSLGGAEPSAKAIPVFPRLTTTDRLVPYERSARVCEVALSLTEPPTPVDGALSELTPLASALAKDLASAVRYYGSQEYQKDGFALGRELHSRLILGFGQLDKVRSRMTSALTTYESQRPTAVCAKDDGERAALDCVEKARVVARRLRTATSAPPGAATDLDDLARCAAAVEASAQTPAGTPWATMMSPSLKAFSDYVAQIRQSPDGRIDVDAQVETSSRFVSVVESKFRATSRAMTMRAQPESN